MKSDIWYSVEYHPTDHPRPWAWNQFALTDSRLRAYFYLLELRLRYGKDYEKRVRAL